MSEQTAVKARIVGPRRTLRGRLHRVDSSASPYLYISPFFLLFGIFGLFPLGYTAWVALTDRTLLNPDTHFVGLLNFTNLIHDSYFWNAVENTLGIWLIATVPQLLIALWLAHLLNTKLRARTFFRMAVLLPQVTSLVAVALIFTQLFSRRLRPRQLRPRRVRRLPHRLGGGPALVLDRALGDGHLALGRLQRADLPRGDAGHPGGALRGRGDRRRQVAGSSSGT